MAGGPFISSADLRLVVLISVFAFLSLSPFGQGQPAAPDQQPSHCPAWEYSPWEKDATVFRPNPARQFPLCIQKDPVSGDYDPVIVASGFDKIIDKINARYKDGWLTSPMYTNFQYDSKIHRWGTGQHQEMQDSLVQHGYQKTSSTGLPNTQIMANWIHVELYRAKEQAWTLIGSLPTPPRDIEGVYIQAIAGPLGIPFGEFPLVSTSDRKVKLSQLYAHRPACGTPASVPVSCIESPKAFFDHSRNLPCTFFAKAGLSVPHVFLWSQKFVPGSPARHFAGNERISFTFKWDENVCAEVSIFQFLIIFVWSFAMETYHVGLSPIFQPWDHDPNPRPRFFETHGLSYPFYRHWIPGEELLLSNTKGVNGKWDMIADPDRDWSYRIVSNLEYEACVQHHVGLKKEAKSRHWECPPGPFVCDLNKRKRPDTKEELAKQKKDDYDQWKPVYLKYNQLLVTRPDCTLPPEPGSTTPEPPGGTGTPGTEEPSNGTTTTTRPGGHLVEWLEILGNATHEKSKRIEAAKKISHGDICAYVWLVLIPTADYVARYYSDFPNSPHTGLGWWIMIHVVIHHISIFLIWFSLGLVATNEQLLFGHANWAHYILGFPVFIIEHYLVIMGHQRDQKFLRLAQRQSYVHAGLGYLSTISSVFCATSMEPLSEKSAFVYGAFGMTLFAHLLASLVERKIAKQLRMFPRRGFFPLLERIVMLNTRPRCRKLKLTLGVFYFTALNVLYGFYKATKSYIIVV